MPHCPVCRACDVAIYQDDADERLDPSSIGSSRTRLSPGAILRCMRCGFAFRKSRFNEQQLADLYRTMDTGTYQAELPGRVRTASLHLRILKRYSPNGNAPGELLDIGCASGVFLLKAIEGGWRVTGLEPSKVLCEEAAERVGGRGVVLPFTLEEADFGNQRFDAITLWDVLEHVVDPVSFMKRCRDLLKANGRLLLNVPDLDSIQARLLGRRWPLLLPEHLNYFNRASLRLCAERCGLRLIRFGRRRSSFSVRYILYRLGQHQIPLAGLLSSASKTRLGRILVPVSLGETYAVFCNPPAPD
jgi:SAM-dependent methyltransferase